MGLLYCCTCLRSPLPRPPWQQVHQPAAALRSPQQLFIEGNSQLCRDGNGKVFPLCSSAPAPGKHEAAWWFPLLLVAAAPPPAPARQRGHTPLSSSRLGDKDTAPVPARQRSSPQMHRGCTRALVQEQLLPAEGMGRGCGMQSGHDGSSLAGHPSSLAAPRNGRPQ